MLEQRIQHRRSPHQSHLAQTVNIQRGQGIPFNPRCEARLQQYIQQLGFTNGITLHQQPREVLELRGIDPVEQTLLEECPPLFGGSHVPDIFAKLPGFAECIASMRGAIYWTQFTRSLELGADVALDIVPWPSLLAVLSGESFNRLFGRRRGGSRGII